MVSTPVHLSWFVVTLPSCCTLVNELATAILAIASSYNIIRIITKLMNFNGYEEP